MAKGQKPGQGIGKRAGIDLLKLYAARKQPQGLPFLKTVNGSDSLKTASLRGNTGSVQSLEEIKRIWNPIR